MKFITKTKKAFTLVELVIVIAIIALLAGLAIPKYKTARLSALVASHNANVQTIKSAAIMYATSNPEATDLNNGLLDYLDGKELPKIPKEIPGGTNWNVTKSDDGDITITPGLVKLDGTKIIEDGK
ncbi:MAG: type II secretion system protein [Tissierellia bacterium]|nr:type II secretion system protein [Tissierellia bacterium]